MLVPLDDARAHVLERIRGALPTEAVETKDAVGRIAAERIEAGEPVPPFDNSAMDGYAVRAADVGDGPEPTVLRAVGRTLAGQAPAIGLSAGTTLRIMTGAPLPEGADTVVPIENVDVDDDGDVVEFRGPVVRGDCIRRAGDDLRPGDVVLTPGTVLTAGHRGLLATLGIAEIKVVRRPRVGVLSTGDELVDDPGTLLLPGQIRDSNRPTLLSLVEQVGAEPVDLGRAGDDAEVITKALLDGVTRCDAILTSGGVSMGDVDLVKEVLDLVGDMRWMQVAIKPAKPFAFGTVDGVPVFGLPGNPVSSVVSFELFARPAIRRLAGHPDGRLDRPCPSATAVDGFPRSPDGKLHFARVVVRVAPDGRLEARSAGGQGSHQMSAMAVANGLAVVPDGSGINAGAPVDVLITGDL
jgi:molybdopterin molybdotransferase